MKRITTIEYDSLTLQELSAEDAVLVNEAKCISNKSYSPYSKFQVGVAIQLESGIVITGCNQENASYPCGTCAERSAIFYAHSQYPDLAPKTICIVAQNRGQFTRTPISPCGACRQALLEYEQKFNSPIRMILYGEEMIYILPSIASTLPFQFLADMMN